MKTPCKLYLTYRSEYLLLQDLCVGVRDRGTGAWLPLHGAVSAQLVGPLTESDAAALPAARVRLGERLCMYATARQIVTGQIIAIEEPSTTLLEEADYHWRAQFAATDPRHSTIRMAR